MYVRFKNNLLLLEIEQQRQQLCWIYLCVCVCVCIKREKEGEVKEEKIKIQKSYNCQYLFLYSFHALLLISHSRLFLLSLSLSLLAQTLLAYIIFQRLSVERLLHCNNKLPVAGWCLNVIRKWVCIIQTKFLFHSYPLWRIIKHPHMHTQI